MHGTDDRENIGVAAPILQRITNVHVFTVNKVVNDMMHDVDCWSYSRESVGYTDFDIKCWICTLKLQRNTEVFLVSSSWNHREIRIVALQLCDLIQANLCMSILRLCRLSHWLWLLWLHMRVIRLHLSGLHLSVCHHHLLRWILSRLTSVVHGLLNLRLMTIHYLLASIWLTSELLLLWHELTHLILRTS